MDPWYDYLALPVVPLLICAQAWVIAERPWPLARGISLGVVVAALVAFAVVLTATDEPDANIGAAFLLVEAVAAAAVHGWGMVRARSA